MKKEVKDQLKAMPVRDLMTRLQELDTEMLKLQSKVRNSVGYPQEPNTRAHGSFGNIRRLKKDIARVKTFLNVKLKAGGKNGKRK